MTHQKPTNNLIWNLILTLCLGVFLISCDQKPAAKAVPYELNQTIYFGGDIITMVGDEPEYVEAVVQREGYIVFTGTKEEAMERFQGKAEEVDLKGSTMLPGFIDGHGHVVTCGLQAVGAKDILPSPDGNGNSVAEVIAILNTWKDENQELIEKSGWIHGFGYDDALLDYYPTKEDLDKVSTEYPVMIIHQSAHLSVLNTKALELMGYDENSKDPAGGVIRRMEGSNEPNGVLEETAHFPAFLKLMSAFDPETSQMMLLEGQKLYASFGYTTGQDGRTAPGDTHSLEVASGEDELLIDIVSYPDLELNKAALRSDFYGKNYKNKYRVAGVKLSIDGSPQGKTAWLSQPYLVPPPGQKEGYLGYPTFTDDELQALVDTAYVNNWQILAHVNGDAAVQQYINAIKKANNAYGNEDRRNVAIHAQTVRMDQLDEFVEEKIWPSFFPMHTYYWGDYHVSSVLGEERAFFISPTATALKKGLKFTSHHDAPVAYPNAIRVLSATVTRASRSGAIIGPDERVSPYIALKALTQWAAYQHFEESSKGTLEKGKKADFVVLDKNPLKIDPMELANLQVMSTIKQGEVIYEKE